MTIFAIHFKNTVMKKYIIISAFALATLFSCATEKDLASLQEQVDAIEQAQQTEISAIRGELEQINMSLKSLGALDRDLTEKIIGLTEKINGLTTRIGNLENLSLEQYEGLVEAVSSIRISIAELTGGLSELSDGYSELSDGYSELADGIAGLSNKYSQLEKALDGLETRLHACEIAIESIRTELASRIQSLTFVPDYYDGKATWVYNKNYNNDVYPDYPVLYFDVQPSSLASVLASNISSLTLRATYTQTRAGDHKTFDIPVTAARVENGLLAVTGERDSVDEGVFLGTEHLNLCLLVSDDVRTISSSYVPVQPMRSNYVIFDDPAFKSFILDCVDGLHGHMDGEVDMEEAESLTYLDGKNSTFKSIGGIGMFPNMQAIDLQGNTGITKIDVTANRALSELNVTGCTAIEELNWDDGKTPAVEFTCNFPLGYALKFNGVDALVCHTGDVWKIITVNFSSQYWDSNRDNPTYCGATSDDGYQNTNLILAATSTCNAANWCRSLGPKWYLPSAAEINDVGINYYQIYGDAAVKPNQRSWIWTSNERELDGRNAGNLHLDGNGKVYYNSKDYTFTTYAMKRF